MARLRVRCRMQDARGFVPGECRKTRNSVKENIMSLLDRVTTLLPPNLNDLVEKAEDPERLLKQIVLDMENQLLQVKTQVAIAIADEHLLAKKRTEHEQQAAEWRRKAEL